MKEIIILGGGESGVGAARLAARLGMNAFLSDSGTLTGAARAVLQELRVPFEEGRHDRQRVARAGLVIKSPGIPDSLPLLVELRAAGAEVISEIEFAGRHTRAAIYGVTGSNGKTTTTLLLHHLLRVGGVDAGLAGNVGYSLAARVATETRAAYVVELSSFQLDGISRFRCDAAILTNITPDHLDRYDHQYSRYIDAKFRVLRNMRPDDLFIYGADSDAVRERVARSALIPRLAPFTCRDDPRHSAWIDAAGRLNARWQERRFSIPLADLPLRGRHNAYNAMAAVLAAMKAGVDDHHLRLGLTTFTPVEHRMERVAEINGVTYINDSKATNVDSAFHALEAVPPPVIWIAGGTDKGNDYAPLLPLVREKVKLLVCMGVDNRKLVDNFANACPIVDVHSLDRAMQAVAERARPGDAVLLSPCCASFDLFKNYEERGRLFKEHVHRLTP
ncbi:MAG: UDP-N-acetylmuramoyl-L-alanine--D-glutamate ligase [Odoribacteraceae bacterium]|nr:UDP-N-acetylmuramoyl-L-alanine--D-glutamate ligase [Odoribacteraceae bacterium]